MGQAVQHCIQNHCVLLDLTLENFKKISPVFEADILDAITIEACVNGRKNYSGTAPECVARQRKVGRAIVDAEEAQIAQWQSINSKVDAL